MARLRSIQQKLMRMILLICGSVLLLTCAAFFAYEFITYRDFTRDELTTIGEMVAANTTAALAFDSREDAEEVLEALKAKKSLVAAVIYDSNGKVFAAYPPEAPSTFPPPGKKGYVFKNSYLEGFQPIMLREQRIGTLYLKSDLKAVYNRFLLYGVIALVFMALSFLFAYLLSREMQKSFSTPLLRLAQTARQVSEQQDYSVRAQGSSNDEVGILIDAFNQMLSQIGQQNAAIVALNQGLEQKVKDRTSDLQEANEVLRQQNEFVETIIDSSIDLIAVFDEERRFLILNKKADEVYRVPRDTMIGRHYIEVFPQLEGSPFAQALEQTLKGEFIHQAAYQSPVSGRYFENFFIPLTDHLGVTRRVLVVGHDMTGIMEANEELKRLNAELEKSNRDLEQFAYVASHDLQEPLRKIQTFSELSEKNSHNPEIQKRYLQKINSSAQRMTELIRAVLNYSRLSKAEKGFEAVDLQEVIRHICIDLELMIEEKSAVVDYKDLPVVEGIPLQLSQLFQNLINNALKFCDTLPRIQVEARPSLLNGAPATAITVRDNGIGFEQQYADRIFAIFQRLHPGHQYSGTGIGLALCKKIVENHRGEIRVESEPGTGTTFTIVLPLRQQEPEATAPVLEQLAGS
jgi:PAS domain S-box-containing protein